MPNATDGTPALTGGISQQAPTVRFASQVSSASNVDFDVALGCMKRSGSRLVGVVSGLTADAAYRLHPIDRDASEKYLMVRGTGTLIMLTSAGTACSVHALSAAWAYLSTASSDQTRVSSLGDTTLICNTAIATGTLDGPAYTCFSSERDADTVFATNPPPGSYVEALGSTPGEPAGFWRFHSSGSTFATIKSSAANVASILSYNAAASQPQSVRVFFTRFAVVSTASWVAATRTLTFPAATLTNYTFADGDSINLTGGGTPEWYEIERRVSATQLVLKTATYSGVDIASPTVTADGIGKAAEMVARLTTADASVDDFALAYTRAFRAAGVPEACVFAERVSTANTVQFVIVSPYAGSSATFPATNAVRAGTKGLNLAAGANYPFAAAYTITAGTGPTATKPAIERWTRVAQSGQPKVRPDPAKMPVRLTREAIAGVWPGGYLAMTTALKPFAYYRLGESSGTAAADAIGQSPGIYVGSPTLAVAGAIAGDSNTAVTFNGTTHQVTLGKLPGIESVLARAFTIECWFRTTTTNNRPVFNVVDIASRTQAFTLRLNQFVTNGLSISLTDLDNNNLSAETAAVTNLNDGNWKHLAVSVNGPANTVAFYVNGTQIATSYSVQNTPDRFEAFAADIAARIASNNADFLAATLDEFTIHPAAFTATMATQRYNQGINASYSHPATFVLNTIDWAVRGSGDQNSNPLPVFLRDQKTIADLAFFQNRLVLASGERIFLSASNDAYRVYAFDAEQIADDDPIDIGLSSKRVTVIDAIAPVQRVLQVFTRAAQQFEVSAGDGGFSAASVSAKATTEYPFVPGTLPAISGLQTYYVASGGDSLSLYEQQYSDQAIVLTAAEVSAHVPTLIASGVRTIVAHPQSNRIILCRGSGATLEIYRTAFRQGEKTQSAWTTFTLESTSRIADIAVLGSDLFMLVQLGSQFALERLPLGRESVPAGYPHTVHLDRQMSLTGSHAAGTTTWTLPGGLIDTTINRAIKPDGTVLTLTSAGGGTTVTASGNHSASAVAVGRSYSASVTLTRPFLRGQSGQASLWAWVQHTKQAFDLQNTRSITFTASQPNTQNRTVAYTSPTTTPIANTQLDGNFGGPCESVTITASDSGAGPFTLTAIQYDLKVEDRK